MSTRSLTVLIDGRAGQEVCVLYRHADGYLSGHGAELKEFLDGFEITTGISDRTKKTANGAGCLFAQMVAHFKKGVGQFYLYSPDTRDVWEDYTYYVTATPGEEIHLKIDNGQVLYDGPVSGFNPEMEIAE